MTTSSNYAAILRLSLHRSYVCCYNCLSSYVQFPCYRQKCTDFLEVSTTSVSLFFSVPSSSNLTHCGVEKCGINIHLGLRTLKNTPLIFANCPGWHLPVKYQLLKVETFLMKIKKCSCLLVKQKVIRILLNTMSI